MEPYRDDPNLTAALRALRPTPRPEFAAKLDARVAAGFPRDSRSSKTRPARLGDRIRAVPPRRLLAPAGGLAVAAIVVASAVVATLESGPLTSPPADSGRLSSPPAQGAGENAALVPFAAAPRSKPSAGGVDSSAVQSADSSARLIGPPRSGPYAARAGHRSIERSAQMVLGADPAEVRDSATKVFDAVHTADGIVLRSSIRDGAAGEAGAEFDLLIPSAKLGDALAAFSSIGEVRSRRESTQDITAPTASTGERLQDSQAKIESLLGQLAATDTDAERAAVEAQLRAERRHSAALRSRLSSLRRRANFSRVSLRIETGAPAATEESEGGWGASDALDDAGRILAVAAGVTVIALAILGPLALIALLAWLAHRALMRRSRERALD